MVNAYNDHYGENYIPSWLSCLDKSMKSWLDKFCPGFMAVPCKPHPLGNEYHSIADGDAGKPIMWRIKIQEGKDRTKDETGKWAFPSAFEGKNATTGRKYTKTSSQWWHSSPQRQTGTLTRPSHPLRGPCPLGS